MNKYFGPCTIIKITFRCSRVPALSNLSFTLILPQPVWKNTLLHILQLPTYIYTYLPTYSLTYLLTAFTVQCSVSFWLHCVRTEFNYHLFLAKRRQHQHQQQRRRYRWRYYQHHQPLQHIYTYHLHQKHGT